MQIFFWIFGVVAVVSFHLGIYFPILSSVLVITAAAWQMVMDYRQSRVGLLTVVLFFVFVLPFIHLVPYLWYDFSMDAPLMFWRLTFNPYMAQQKIVELTAMIGAVGAAGFAAGVLLLRGSVPTPGAEDYRKIGRDKRPTLGFPVFLIWVMAAVGFTWISAPQDTIWTAVYTQSKAISADWNFASAWMVSYSVLLFTLADAIFEGDPRLARWKRSVVLLAFILIVVWFQLLRGDRESIPCVFAAVLMCCVWGKKWMGSFINRIRFNALSMILGALLVLAVVYFIGVLRSAVAGVTSLSGLWHVLVKNGLRPDDIFQGTWSAVFLTPLSVAGDHINGILPLKFGQTYLDLVASVMPGFLANWIGYVRPIDGLHGPAWAMTYGIGGTHAVVVPFMNFRLTGVFGIVALWSFCFAAVERQALKNISVSSLALLGIIVMAAPHWLWYGEKYIMNALIIWLLLSVVYNFYRRTGSLREENNPC